MFRWKALRKTAVLIFVSAAALLVVVSPVLALHDWSLISVACDSRTNTITVKGNQFGPDSSHSLDIFVGGAWTTFTFNRTFGTTTDVITSAVNAGETVKVSYGHDETLLTVTCSDSAAVNCITDARINPHCGAPVAIYGHSSLSIWGINKANSEANQAFWMSAEAVAALGDVSSRQLLWTGQTPNGQAINLYWMPGGLFRLVTQYWDGKFYIVEWTPGDKLVTVFAW